MRAVLAACLAVLLVGAWAPASAANSPGPIPDVINGVPFERYIQEHNHALGSQIRRVESAGDMSKNKPSVPSGVPGIDVSSHQGKVRLGTLAGKR